ncbi:FprA family A-type flavoprotein [Candidatus Bathyarchaeota archaeon]|nr:FprA family A-type flavoprotein [Candidatus Bathyarchaeota archaeon]
MKALVIYDSRTGNTEKMARAIAEGASSVEGVSVEVRRIGEMFPLSILADGDLTFYGSPVIYADVTEGFRSFLEHLKRMVEDGRMRMKGKVAAVFGSYGFDGAWVMEERMKRMLENIGYKVYEKACVETADSVRYRPERALENCRSFGREVAEAARGKI